MKKFVLFFIVFGLMVSVFGQNQAKTEMVKKNMKRSLVETDFHRTTPLNLQLNYDKSTNLVERIPVGTAKSQRSFRREDCRVVSYNKDADVIAISFVIDPATYPEAELPGYVAAFYSSDHGQTWDGPVLTSYLTDEGIENYYLSGALYNPTGNTDPMNTYAVYQGVAADYPVTGTSLWNNKAFGSSTLAGENYTTEYFTNEEPNFEHDGYFNQFGLTQIEDYMRCWGIIAEGAWGDFSSLELEVIQGNYNDSGFDWETQYSVVEFPWELDIDGFEYWVGGYVFSDIAGDAVWSDDGQIGYAWLGGLNTELETGFQPIIFKTTNGGDDWDFVEIDFQDSDYQDYLLFDEETGESGYIFSARDINDEPVGYCIPWFNATAAAVDANGNLQLFADLNGHYYEFGEWYTADKNEFSTFTGSGHLFKFTIGENEEGDDGLLDMMWIDSLRSNPVLDVPAGGDPNLYCGSSGWLRRLQLTKNESSTEFFLTWTDTEDGDGLVDNLSPDVHGWSYNINTDTHSERTCFTCGTLFEGYYWYVQASDYAMYDPETETYTVPMINAISIDEFSNNSSGSGDPVSVDYVTGIEFPDLDPSTGVSDISATQGISVSQNQPNPFNGTTTIEISSNTTAHAMIEVSNIMGQTVYTMDAGTINGSKKVDLNVSNLESGVYFYTVTIGNESVSKKMIIE